MNAQDPDAIRDAGKMRLKANPMAVSSSAITATLNIRHPMRTGLQRDLVSQGFVPAWYIKKLTVDYKNSPVLAIDVGISVSEDPYFQFNFSPKESGQLRVSIVDTEEHAFAQTLNLN